MLRIVTVGTTDFLCHAERLLLSLRACCASFHLTVYCDDATAFAGLAQASAPVSVVPLPEIRALGVKRAKFTAYAKALEEGDFLYLDADIIVLDALDELWGFPTLAGCPDDLSACGFIEDKRHPWPGDPGLVNETYVNSGVLFFPRAVKEFVEDLRRRSLCDEEWQRYILPGKLFDNHFLCAHINLRRLPIHLLDETVYNWQGFFRNGELQVLRRGNELVNCRSGQKLRLVHFAGIADPDSFLSSLPVDVASLICERAVGGVESSPARSFTRFLASLSGSFRQSVPDEFVPVVFRHLSRELLAIGTSGFRRDYRHRDSYFEDPQSMLDLLYSKPTSDLEWNGLTCGGPCLDGTEYNYLFLLLTEGSIRSVIEIGAGETSLLFRRLGLQALSLEPTPGPWLDKARAAGCDCHLVPFDPQTLLFDAAALESSLQAWTGRPVDLLFLDSPTGSRSRSRILLQLLAHLHPRLVLFHDAHRDASNLLSYQLEAGLTLIDYHPSRRGLALYANGGDTRLRISRLPADRILDGLTVEMEAAGMVPSVTAGDWFSVPIRLKNLGEAALSSDYAHPVHVAYHWFDTDGRCVLFEGNRTRLPFDIHPGHLAKFPVMVQAPGTPGVFRCQICLLQEGIRWYDRPQDDASVWLTVAVSSAKAGEGVSALGARLGVLEQGGQFVSAETYRKDILTSLGIITADMIADPLFLEIYEKCRPYTITSMERIYALYQAVGYLVENGIVGDIVECGVWMGGSSMAAACTLLAKGDLQRRIWLYDTFEGMACPSAADVRFDGESAAELWAKFRRQDGSSGWWNAPLEQVRVNLLSTGYPPERIVFVKGKVEETLSDRAPERIALLRLDTDWYKSTRCELEHLFPRLVQGGVLILDDYGWWSGSRKAADEYFRDNGIRILLNRIDSSGARLGLKL